MTWQANVFSRLNTLCTHLVWMRIAAVATFFTPSGYVIRMLHCSVQNVQDKRALYKGASSPQFCTWRAAVAANSRFCSLQGSYNISKMECTKSLLPWFSFRPGVYKACSAWKRIVFYCCKYSLANARLCLRFSYSTTIIFLETLASCTH